MPYTREQIETLKATDPEIVKQALNRMDEGQRNELMAAIKQYSQPAHAAKPAEQPQQGVGFLGGVKAGVQRSLRALEELRVGREQETAKRYGIENTLGSNEKFYQPGVERRAKEEAEFQKEQTASGASGKAGRFVGEMVLPMAVSMAAPRVGGGLAARMALSGAESAATTYGTTPGEERKSAAVVGGLMGAAGPAVAKGASKLGSKALDALAGTKLGNILGIKTKVEPRFEGASDLAKQMEAQGLKPTAADVTGDPALAGRQAALSRRDPEFMRFQQEQNKALANTADRVVSDLKSVVMSEKWTSLDQVKAAAVGGGKRAGAAKMLLTAIENSGDDWKEIAQQSGNLKLFLAKLKADANFDKVSSLSRNLGVTVQPSKTVAVLDDTIRKLEGDAASDPATLAFLQKLRGNIANGKQDLTFEGLRQTRSSLGGRVADAKMGKTVPTSEVAVLSRLQEAMESDIRKSMSRYPELQQAYQKANLQYKTEVAPFKDVQFSKALTATDPTAGARIFESLGDSAKQKRYFDLLEAKGKAAVRYGLIDKAVAAGERAQVGSSGITFSPASVATQIEKMAKAGLLDIVFEGSERQSVDGLAKILRTMQSYGTIGVPSAGTGVTAESIGAATKALGPKELAAKIFDKVSGDNFKKTLMDPNSRLLLVRASKMEPGDPKLVDLASKFFGVSVAKQSKDEK